MDPLTLTGIAATLIKTGPDLIRTIGSFFADDKQQTANKVADLVDIASGKSHPETALNQALTALSPSDLVNLKTLALECETELARIEATKQIEIHQQTQATIQNGDNSNNPYVSQTRPWMARLSGYATALYVMGLELAKAFNKGDGPSLDMAMLLIAPLLAYMGLREVGKWRQGQSSPFQSLSQIIRPFIKKGA
jgi:hypothetical protein